MTQDGGHDDPVRAQERRRLAHELHDIVTHHLANVALRTMGQLDRVDPNGLRTILEQVNGAAGSALVELRLLARVLDDGPAGAGGAAPWLEQEVPPRAAALAWRRRLREAGMHAEYALPDTTDQLARSVQSTITRAFRATGEATLRHATAGSRCAVRVDVEANRAVVRCSTVPPPAGSGAAELEPRLRGLRERVDLLRGHFGAGVTEPPAGAPQWCVTIILPLD